MYGPQWVLAVMKSESENLEEIFRLLLEADRKLWEAVAAIHENETALSALFIQPIMQMRGDIHVNFLRPMYKKFPELEKKFGLDDEPSEKNS